MHAVLVKFRSEISVADLAGPFGEYAEALCSVPGLISKTWIKDGDTLGGFHLFGSRAQADSYLGSEMVAGLTSTPGFSDFSIDHFDVIEGLSFKTGTPRELVSV